MTDPKRSNGEIATKIMAEVADVTDIYYKANPDGIEIIENALDAAEKSGFISGHNDGYKFGVERGAAEMRDRFMDALKRLEENIEKEPENNGYESALNDVGEVICALPLSPSEKDGK